MLLPLLDKYKWYYILCNFEKSSEGVIGMKLGN